MNFIHVGNSETIDFFGNIFEMIEIRFLMLS